MNFPCLRSVRSFLSIAWIASIGCAPLHAQDAPPASIHPEVGSIQKTIVMSGYFSPASSTEIAVRLDTNLSLKVLKAAEHGDVVRAGDVLIEFDAHDAKEQLAQQEAALQLQKLNLEEAQREARIAEAKDPLDEEFAELTKRRADEDFAFFLEREFPMNQRSAEQTMKSSKDYLDYVAEELRQLEKMYKADDLTEESEEIVLRRAKDDLDRARFSFEWSELNYRRSLDLNLPRSKSQEQTQHRLAEIAFEQFKMMRPLILEKRRLALKKQHMDFEKASHELDKLRSDLKKLRIEAPHDGVVYYGKSSDGKFSNVTEMLAKLRPYGAASPNEVLMTIVRPGALVFLGSLPESDLDFASTGTAASIVPGAFSKMSVDGRIQRVASIPSGDGNYQVHLELPMDAPKKVVAGMTGKAKWIAYYNPKAITVPNRYIHQDPEENDASYVWVLNAESKPEKRWVESGITSGDRTEIFSGLTASEQLVESDGSKK